MLLKPMLPMEKSITDRVLSSKADGQAGRQAGYSRATNGFRRDDAFWSAFWVQEFPSLSRFPSCDHRCIAAGLPDGGVA